MKFKRVNLDIQTVFRIKGSFSIQKNRQSFTWSKIDRKNKFRAIFSGNKLVVYVRKDGDIAQLGERLNGIQEVSGSIPLISTVSGFNNLEKQQCLV